MSKRVTIGQSEKVIKKLYWSMVGKGVDHVNASAIKPATGPYVIDLIDVSDKFEVHTLELMTVNGIKDAKKKVTVKLTETATTKGIPKKTAVKLEEANDKYKVERVVKKMLGDAIKQARKIKT
jgi:hypothetical protein